MYNKIIFSVIALVLFLSGCSPKTLIRDKDYHEKLSNCLIFNIDSLNLHAMREHKAKVYMGKDMVFRKGVFLNEEYGYSDTLNPNVLYSPTLTDSLKVEIPANLSDIYSYFTDTNLILDDSSTVAFVSPLLKTNDKNVYGIQTYLYTIMRDRDVWFRVKLFRLDRYLIKRGKLVKKLEPIELPFYTIGDVHFQK